MQSILTFQKWTFFMSKIYKPKYFMDFWIPPYDNLKLACDDRKKNFLNDMTHFFY